MKKCLAKYLELHKPTDEHAVQEASEACRRAVERGQSTEPKQDRNVDAFVATCLRLRNALGADSAIDQARAASDACRRAIEATGLTSQGFWAKYGAVGAR